MKETEKSPLISPKASDSTFDTLKIQCQNLLQMPKSLFILYFLNFLSSGQYYILITLIPIYFSEHLGTSDLIAGLIFGLYGLFIGIISISIGPLVESLSIKNGLFITYLSSVAGFAIMTWSSNFVLNTVAVLLVLSISGATAWPIIQLGSKECTVPSVRTLSNTLVLVANYLAGIACGLAIDFNWEPGSADFYILFFGIGGILGIGGLFTTLFLNVKDDTFSEPEDEEQGEIPKTRIWKFIAVIMIITLMMAGCYGQLDASIPKYMLRTIGPESHFGVMLAIHSVTMLIGALLLTVLTHHYSSYTLLIISGFVGTVSTFWMIAGYDYWNMTMFVVIASLAESIWTPRLLDYTLEVAPRSQEAVYLALCNCPFYFGMIVTGALSGVLFELFCFESQAEECWCFWLTASIIANIFPVVLVVARKWLEITKMPS